MPFKKAIKNNAKLRMAICGIAGAGKTWTSLLIAEALAHGQPIALIDSEHGSASKYADDFQFDVLELSNFNPENYIKAILEAEEAGYAVLIIDGLSQGWNGPGGALELVDSVARQVAERTNKKTPNTFNAWGTVTPLQNHMIDTMLTSPLHIIVTMRSKMEYVVDNSSGYAKPTKVGMGPIQRSDVEYEFDVFAEMDINNTMTIAKSRCRALSGQVIPKPDASLAEVLEDWLKGQPLDNASANQIAMKRLLRDFYALSPLTYVKIANWEQMALQKALGTKEIPEEYTDEDLSKMKTYVVARRREKEAKEAATTK